MGPLLYGPIASSQSQAHPHGSPTYTPMDQVHTLLWINHTHTHRSTTCTLMDQLHTTPWIKYIHPHGSTTYTTMDQLHTPPWINYIHPINYIHQLGSTTYTNMVTYTPMDQYMDLLMYIFMDLLAHTPWMKYGPPWIY